MRLPQRHPSSGWLAIYIHFFASALSPGDNNKVAVPLKKCSSSSWYWQLESRTSHWMKVTLAIATFCVVMACSHAARTTTTTATKPGRFLSLPVPAKCASRKYTGLWPIFKHHCTHTHAQYHNGEK
ncbi:GD22691 [Drosophila simulans]|uniref:GD22691 n=1 Tax=Drosophila simulans TaxID=7240 RepID=B4Q327_DROSI|nr:GD22691 [Drosophila simulans]